jgi:peptide deformylase
MSTLSIRTYPDPILRKKAEPVSNFDESLKKCVTEMAEKMFEMNGIGLAAPQIGLSSQIVIISLDEDYLPLINPVILEKGGKRKALEGCLSLPSLEMEVERYERIKVSAQNVQGERIEFEASNLFARVIQHELDHLNALLIIDRISGVKRQLIKNSLHNMREEWSDRQKE